MANLANIDTVIIPATERTVWRHIVLTSDDGRTGVGEYTLYQSEIDAVARKRANSLIGSTTRGALASISSMPMTNLVEATVNSALDQALRDLVAQETGVSLARHLNPGSTKESVFFYANINRRTRNRSPVSVAASARAAIEEGYDAIKIAPFDNVSPDNCESVDGHTLIEAGLERLRAAAHSIGNQAQLLVDCHWRFTPKRARELIVELGELGVSWFECPLPETVDAVNELRKLRSAANDRGMRLAGCETMFGREGFAPYLSAEAYDAIMPDVKHAGGLVELMRIAEDASKRGIGVSLHNPSGPIAHGHSVHVACALTAEERLEIQFDESPLFMSITDPKPVIADGAAIGSTCPGLGLRLKASKRNGTASLNGED